MSWSINPNERDGGFPSALSFGQSAQGIYCRLLLRDPDGRIPDHTDQCREQLAEAARAVLKGSTAQKQSDKLAAVVADLTARLAACEATRVAAVESAGLTEAVQGLRQRLDAALATAKPGRDIRECERQLADLLTEGRAVADRLAEIERRRADPATVTKKDGPRQLLLLDEEEAGLQQRKREIESALPIARRHAAAAAERWRADVQAAARQATAEVREAATRRHMELVARLAEVVGPVLTELLAVEADLLAIASPLLLDAVVNDLAGGSTDATSATSAA